MNNVKIIYYNVETIDDNAFENIITSNAETISHFTIKPGLMLVNFRGSARDLYMALGEVVKERSILILDLDSEVRSYYGFMNKEIWNWLEINRN